MDTKYPQVARWFAETPWAILASAFTPIAEMVAYAVSGRKFTAEEIEARIGNAQQPDMRESVGTVAVLNLFGTLVPRADLFSQISGGTSLERFCAAFDAALASDNVDAILLNVDSPGGSVDLVAETAATVREARGKKPIVAIANTTAASAAYWIAAQADELIVTPSGRVGSVGVFAAHTDISAMQEADGIKTTLVSAGKFKTEGNPFEPLSDEARAAIQERVDEAYSMFVADVAAGRGVSQDKVRSGYGEGRTLLAQQALEAGMVDGVATLEETVARMVQSAAETKLPGSAFGAHATITGDNLVAFDTGNKFADEADNAIVRVKAVTARAEALAALRKGRPRPFSAANRERLAALNASLEEAKAALGDLLAATDPAEPALQEEFARELLRSQFIGA
jgi:signal peptide peptidase SppA